MKNNRVIDDLRIFGLVWFGMVKTGLVSFWSGMVDGYYLDVIPCKNWKSYFEKQLSYGQYMEIWFGLVWLGLVWFGLVWFGFESYGTWLMSRYLVWFGMFRTCLVWFGVVHSVFFIRTRL